MWWNVKPEDEYLGTNVTAYTTFLNKKKALHFAQNSKLLACLRFSQETKLFVHKAHTD